MEQTTFTDSDGVLWNVCEDGAHDRHSLASDSLPGTAWLRFESDLEVRRLWHYPDDWRGLNPLQLESLLDRASTVIARFRPAVHRAVDVDTSLDGGRQRSSLQVSPRRADAPPADPPSPGRRKPV